MSLNRLRGEKSLSAGYTLSESGKKVPLLEATVLDPTAQGAVAETFQAVSAAQKGVEMVKKVSQEIDNLPDSAGSENNQQSIETGSDMQPDNSNDFLDIQSD